MVGSESMHPANTFGCTPCHGGRDRATSFWSAGHSPETEAQRASWTKKYDWEFDRFNETPVLPLKYAEGGCYRCHSSEANFHDAPTLDAGMRVVEGLGCWGCHRIDGLEKQGLPKVGPSLEKVASKLETTDWAKRWVMNPAAFRANTGPGIRRPQPRPSSRPATRSCRIRTANSSTAIFRSRTPIRPSNASRRRWAISTAKPAPAPT